MNDKSIKIGDIVKAEITGLQKYGAFVKFGKYRGLIHISEIKSGYVADIHGCKQSISSDRNTKSFPN